MITLYATYIDNQKEIGYPIHYLTNTNPNLVIFTSDKENQNYILNSTSHHSNIIDFKIKNPGDIATAQNICIEKLFSLYGVDFIVWQQADIFIMPKGTSLIEEFCVEKNLDQTMALGLMHIKLFHNCGYSYYGVNVIGRKAWQRIKFTGDGAYLGSGGADYCAKEDATLDIGYLSTDQCRRHMAQHKKTWTSNDNTHELPDDEFVKEVLRKHNYSGIIEKDSDYYKLIVHMGYEEEYEKVKKIMYG